MILSLAMSILCSALNKYCGIHGVDDENGKCSEVGMKKNELDIPLMHIEPFLIMSKEKTKAKSRSSLDEMVMGRA